MSGQGSPGLGLIGWGSDYTGIVGTGLTVPDQTDVPAPTPVAPTADLIGKKITKVVAAYSTTCAIADGDPVCWGWSGLPTLADRTGVLPRGGVSDIDVMDSLVCAVAGGKAFCWGDNYYGQLGNNSTAQWSDVPSPVWDKGVLAGRRIQQVAAGGEHACALSDGRVFCWGRNLSGVLGNGSTVDSRVPVAVDTSGPLAGLRVDEIATGSATVCARAQGRVFCWGDQKNLGYELPFNSTLDYASRPAPVDTSGALSGRTVTDLDMGLGITCVIADGAPFCWGANGPGALGANFTGLTSLVPQAVVTTGALRGKTVTDLVVGEGTVCVLASGSVICWGNNQRGLLGIGTVGGASLPVAVDTAGALSGRRVVALGGGNLALFAITAEPVPVGLKAVVNGRYVSAESSGSLPLIANRSLIGEWERFTVTRLGGDRIVVRALVNDRLVCADGAGASPLIANRSAVGAWETFSLIINGDGTVSFRSAANNRIVTAEAAGSASLVANRTAVGLWEKFSFVAS